MAKEIEHDIYPKLQWLIVARVLFTSILLVSTVLTHWQAIQSQTTDYLSILYYLTGSIFGLSILYAVLSPRIKRQLIFGYIQIGIDAVFVTLIVFITGGYFSFFTFLYIVVVIYGSLILYLKGGLILSVINSLCYGTMLIMQFLGFLPSLGSEEARAIGYLTWMPILHRIFIIAIACLAVAFLCGVLTEQNRKNQKKIMDMEIHLKRVDKLAYMGEMAAGLAHEIRNPLASLSGSIQLLKEDLPYHEDHQRLMKIVLRETDRLATLVNQFLFFAKPPSAKMERVNIKEAVKEICTLFEKDPHFTQGLFTLERKVAPELWVMMDSLHLHQVIWNLLLNAADAISGHGRIVIEAIPIKNNAVQFSIKDNGCGISEEAIQSIFNPFFTTKPEGTGLGLSIVHRILEGYQSRLEVESKVGQGTTFTFPLKLESGC